MSLTKQEIVDSIQERLGLSKSNSSAIFESLLEIIKSNLESGQDLLISGFGKFCVINKKERKGKNPQTGEDKILGARRVVIFRCSSVLRDKINGEK